ncbi:MAG: GGDEF domain-containing protein [Rhodoferax sp.]|nr:GGDEF domain-containing protein [Rhodoferax sp.]
MTATILAIVATLLGCVALYLAYRLRRAGAQKRQLIRYVKKLQNAERSLKKHAFFDPLTGLANRSLLIDRFQLAMQHSKRSLKQFAVLMIDLNKFKDVNDTYGHSAGDTVLVTIAQRLVSLVRSTDTVARLGGDEFVLIIESVAEREQIASLGRKLVDLLTEPITLDSGEVVSLGGSIGFAWYPKDGENLKDILEVADQAMYFCKTSGLMPFS